MLVGAVRYDRPADWQPDLTKLRIAYAEFLQLLVSLSFDHANPEAAAALAATANAVSEASSKIAEKAVVQDLPGCLQTMLQKMVLPHAKRDRALAERDALENDPVAQEIVHGRSAELIALFKELSAGGPGGVRLPSLIEMLKAKGVLGEVSVAVQPAGGEACDILSVLDETGVARCFVDSQETAPSGAPVPTLQLSQFTIYHTPLQPFTECLLRIAEVRFATVDQMDRPARMRALMACMLDGLTVTDAIVAASSKPASSRAVSHPAERKGSAPMQPDAAAEPPKPTFRERLLGDSGMQAVFTRYQRLLDGLFADLVAKTRPAAPAGQRKQAALKNSLGSEPSISAAVFAKMADDAGLVGRTLVRRASSITGDRSGRDIYEIGATPQQLARLHVASVDGGSASSLLTYEQFKEALARLGHVAYKGVASMDGADVVEATIKNVLQQEPPATIVASATYVGLHDRLNAWVDSVPLPGESQSSHEAWLNTWHNVNLSGLYGFPLWEREVHDALQRAFSELVSIFAHYAKATSRSNVAASKTMDFSEFVDFCTDCKLVQPGFEVVRIRAIFYSNLSADDAVLHPSQFGKSGHKPNVEMRVPLAGFLRVLVATAFHRANPSIEALGDASQLQTPLPDCLQQLLESSVLPLAKRDSAPDFRRRFQTDAQAQALVAEKRPDIRSTWAVLKVRQERAEGVPMEGFLDYISKRSLIESVEVLAADLASHKTAAERSKHIYWSSLTVEQAKDIFMDAEASDLAFEGATSAKGINALLDLDEFTEALARLGALKYALVEEMQLADRVGAVLSNLFDGASCADAIRAFVAPPPSRYSAAEHCAPLAGESAEALGEFVYCWGCIRMADIHGFPTWEGDACAVLHTHFAQLLRIFAHYAGVDAAGPTAPSLLGSRELPLARWIDLIKACSICNRTFALHRAVNAFHSGCSAAATNGATNESSAGLTLPEFLSALMRLALWRANPLYAEARSIVEIGIVASNARAEAELLPLPDCLKSLLEGLILPNAARCAGPVHWQRAISTEAEAAALLPGLRDRLGDVLSKLVDHSDGSAGERAVSAERMVRLLDAAGLLGRLEVRQRKAVTPQPNDPPVLFVADLPERVARLAFADARHAVLADGTACVLRKAPAAREIELAHLEEFVCRVAAKKYAACYSHMTLSQRLAATVDNLCGDEAPRKCIGRAVAMPPPPRMDAAAAARGKVPISEGLLELWLGAWAQCDLSALPGFPLWEEGVHAALAAAFADVLHPAFLCYCRCKPAPSPADTTTALERGKTLGLEEWMQFCADCKLASKGFDLRALRRAHSQSATRAATRAATDSGVPEKRLTLPSFLRALVGVAFSRANVAWLEAPPPGSAVPWPLPDCLVEMLQHHVTPHAQRDSTAAALARLRADSGVRAVLQTSHDALADLHRLALPEAGEGAALEQTMGLLRSRLLFGAAEVQQRSEITGDPAARVVHRSALDAAAAVRCFVSASRATFFLPSEDADRRALLSFAEWCDFVCLLAVQKYGGVGGMELGTQLRALVSNLLGEADTRGAIEEATFKTAGGAYDAHSEASPLHGESEDEL